MTMMDREIQALVTYALDTGLIEPCERMWAVNTLLEALGLDSYTEPETPAERPVELTAVLTALMDDAHARGVLKEDSVVYRDLFDTMLMGRLTPGPPRSLTNSVPFMPRARRRPPTGTISSARIPTTSAGTASPRM